MDLSVLGKLLSDCKLSISTTQIAYTEYHLPLPANETCRPTQIAMATILVYYHELTLIAKFMAQVGPMLAPWTSLSGPVSVSQMKIGQYPILNSVVVTWFENISNENIPPIWPCDFISCTCFTYKLSTNMSTITIKMIYWKLMTGSALCDLFSAPGGRLNKKDGLTRYGDSHVKDKTS